MVVNTMRRLSLSGDSSPAARFAHLLKKDLLDMQTRFAPKQTARATSPLMHIIYIYMFVIVHIYIDIYVYIYRHAQHMSKCHTNRATTSVNLGIVLVMYEHVASLQ